ncbi:hypothetical protein ASG33_13135 [Dyadobacter sp. Leaf189]|nr:hypothetical protein ASG33_13135 [Dyadobacter sp. Leaf189]
MVGFLKHFLNLHEAVNRIFNLTKQQVKDYKYNKKTKITDKLSWNVTGGKRVRRDILHPD